MREGLVAVDILLLSLKFIICHTPPPHISRKTPLATYLPITPKRQSSKHRNSSSHILHNTQNCSWHLSLRRAKHKDKKTQSQPRGIYLSFSSFLASLVTYKLSAAQSSFIKNPCSSHLIGSVPFHTIRLDPSYAFLPHEKKTSSLRISKKKKRKIKLLHYTKYKKGRSSTEDHYFDPEISNKR